MADKKAGRKAHTGDRKTLLGYRMKLAAEQAGYQTTVAMAEAFGTDNATISRYWRGLQTPGVDDLERYAQLVGKRLWWFYLSGSDQEFDLVAETLREIVLLAVEGKDLAAAYEAVTGREKEFGRRERQELTAGTPAVVERVRSASGDQFLEMKPASQRKVLDRIAAEALHSREEE